MMWAHSQATKKMKQELITVTAFGVGLESDFTCSIFLTVLVTNLDVEDFQTCSGSRSEVEQISGIVQKIGNSWLDWLTPYRSNKKIVSLS